MHECAESLNSQESSDINKGQSRHLMSAPNKTQPTAPKALIELPPPADEMTISFAGPFSWTGADDAPCVYDAAEARKSGIYLWTVPQPSGHLVYYVGETGRTFAIRLRDHYEELVAARYHVYSAAKFARGEKVCLWPGRYDTIERKSDKECQANSMSLSGHIRGMALVIRFFLAPLSRDIRLRRRVEAAIAQLLYVAPGMVGAFQDRGIHYSPRKDGEQPIACNVISRVPLLGVPGRFSA